MSLDTNDPPALARREPSALLLDATFADDQMRAHTPIDRYILAILKQLTLNLIRLKSYAPQGQTQNQADHRREI